jgi:hypothetical protein
MVDFQFSSTYVCTVRFCPYHHFYIGICVCINSGRGSTNSLQASRELVLPLPLILHTHLRMYK